MSIYFWVDERRKPWANTVAYRPLTSTTTVNDQSWNNYTLTRTWGSFTTIGGVDCFYNGWWTSGYFTLNSAPKIPSWSAARTISLWVKPTNYSRSYDRYILDYGGQTAGSGVAFLTTMYGLYEVLVVTDYMDWASVIVARKLLTFTTSWSGYDFYINWVLQWHSSYALNTSAVSSSFPLRLMRQNTTTSDNNQLRWYLSEVIIEDKAWTATEIENYFNDNKSKYWL